jgi:radical SAM protein with 4Fe4S-binding SPASM domain
MQVSSLILALRILAMKNEPKYCAYPWQQMVIDLTGEVVPCCFWSGYGNSGKPLGNTNVNSIEEIWNGPEYQSLRRVNASGNLEGHPCNQCMSYQWTGGTYPSYSLPTSWRHDSGYCYLGKIPENFLNLDGHSPKEITVTEDGELLPLPDTLHDEIRQLGSGRYSVWKGYLYLSSSDNTDPRTNGRCYELISVEGEFEFQKVELDSPSAINIVKAQDEFTNGIEILESKPSMISLISTADCNIDCPACSQNLVRLVNVQHRPETVPDILDHVPYLYQFIWQGGEPYIIKKFRQFIDSFHTEDNPNLTFGFTTNGTMLNKKELAKLRKFPRINASISFDSFNKETFEKIRKGADYNKVLDNLVNAFNQYENDKFVFSCGMIICKTNMNELAMNVEFALHNGFGMNFSPVVVYPVTEQLDVFEDFDFQTAGWEEQLNQAEKVIASAKKNKSVAIQRVDPTGMIKDIRLMYERSLALYKDTYTITVLVTDPYGSLPKMECPGVIVYLIDGNSVAYCRFREGEYEYQLKIPKSIPLSQLNLSLLHSLLEPHGGLIQDPYLGDVVKKGVLKITLPQFDTVDRPPNGTYIKYGESTPDGLHVVLLQDIENAYDKIANYK